MHDCKIDTPKSIIFNRFFLNRNAFFDRFFRVLVENGSFFMRRWAALIIEKIVNCQTIYKWKQSVISLTHSVLFWINRRLLFISMYMYAPLRKHEKKIAHWTISFCFKQHQQPPKSGQHAKCTTKWMPIACDEDELPTVFIWVWKRCECRRREFVTSSVGCM